jgi:hypothetical protein
LSRSGHLGYFAIYDKYVRRLRVPVLEHKNILRTGRRTVPRLINAAKRDGGVGTVVNYFLKRKLDILI